MPDYTEHYNLIKPKKTENYNIEVANTNSETIDEELYKKQEKVPGKGLSTNDFTDAYKNKLDNLKNITNNNELENGAGYQNEEQVEEKIEELVPLIIDNKLVETKKLIENSMKTMHTEGTIIHVEDSADYGCKLKIEGKTEQEQTENSPSPSYPSPIENVEGNLEVKVVGKNLINPESNINLVPAIQGTYTTGVGYIYKCKPNTTYTLSRNKNTSNRLVIGYSAEYPVNGGNVTQVGAAVDVIGQNVTRTITTNDTANYIVVSKTTMAEASNATDVILMLEEKSTATEFEEYKEQTVTFPFAEGQKMYKDSYLADDGIHHVRKYMELDGTESWSLALTNTNTLTFQVISNTLPIRKPNNNDDIVMISNNFKGFSRNQFVNDKETQSISPNTFNNVKSIIITISKQIVGNLEEFKAYLAAQNTAGTPVVVEYELETEETTPYTTEQQAAWQQIEALKTYRTITNITNNQNTNMELTYKKDLQTQLAELEALLESGASDNA